MKKFIFLLAIVFSASFSFLGAQQFAIKDALNSKQTELKTQQVLETEQVDVNPQSELFFQELSVKAENESTRPATRAELELGYCDGYANTNYGTNIPVGAQYLSGCVNFTAEYMSNYVGMTLHSIETGISTTSYLAGMTSYRIWIKTALNGAVVYEEDVTSQVVPGAAITWKNFTLATPYTITNTPLVIGYTIGYNLTTAAARYPMPTEVDYAPYPRGAYGFLLSTNINGHGAGAAFAAPVNDRALHIWGKVTGTPLNNNLCAADIALGASTDHTILGNPLSFTAIVFNAGTLPQSNYSVQFLQQPSNTLLTTVPVTTTIAPGAFAKIPVTIPASATGDFAVKAKVVLTGDQNPADDITSWIASDYVYPAPPLTWCNKSALAGGGYGANLVGSTAIGYTTANSGPWAGSKLTAIRIAMSSPYTTYTNCMVWIASTLATSQTYIYTQNFTPTNDGWVTVVLNTPYELPATQTYIGWTGTCSSTGQFTVTNNPPAVLDGGRIKNGTSAWTTVSAAFGTNYNSALIGVVVPIPPCPPVTNLNATVNGNNVNLTWTAATGTPTGYEIRFRGTLLTTVPAGTTSYTHVNAPNGKHEYCVTALHGAEECKPQPVCVTVTKGEVCNLTLVMKGTSTTSWNATTGGIEVIADGYSYGIFRGSGATLVTHNLILPEGAVNFIWTTGGTPAQQSFDILNVCGEVIYSKAAGSLSAGISPLAFSVTHGCPCEKLGYLIVDVQENCDADLTFYEVVPPINGWAKHCASDAIKGQIGWDEEEGNNMTAAIRFTPSDMADRGIYSGQTITKIAIGTGTDLSSVNTMELRIWEGGTSVAVPGTLKYTQPITGFAAFPEESMVEIVLTTPYVIDATKELRIGWNLVNTAGYPFGRDVGPNVAGKGLLFQCPDLQGGSWFDAAPQYGWNFNWSLKAFVTGNNHGIVLEPLLVNIYRDGTLIEEEFFGNTYTDVRTNFDVTLPHTWAVAKICEDGREACKIFATAAACKSPVVYDCQVEKTVGTGNVAIRVNPIDVYYDYSYTQQIYDASEIGLGGPGILGSVSFYYTHTEGLTVSNVNVYVGNTTTTTFSSNTAWITPANMTLVYSGEVDIANGWVTIVFNTPFNYTGGGLVVALNKMSTEWIDYTGSPWQATSTGTNNKTIYISSYTITAPYNPASPGTGTRITNRPNAKFAFCDKQYTLNPNDIYGEGATVTMVPNPVTHGQNSIVYFTIDPCYSLDDVIIGGVSMGPITSYNFNNVTAPLPMIEVITHRLDYNIVVTFGANGTVTPNGTVNKLCGESQTFTITPNTGYNINQVLINGTNNPTAVTTGTYTFSGTITNNQTLHATFTPKQFTLTLNPDGGTVSPTFLTVTYDAPIGTMPNATRTGYTFGGWWTGQNGTGTQVVGTDIWKGLANLTVYAKWTAITYTLSFNSTPLTPNPASITVTYDAAIGGLPVLNRPGYTYVWQISGTTITSATVWKYTSNQTAVAVWTPITYTLTLDPSTGTCGTPSIQIVYNTTITFLPNATQPGCIFIGWFIGADQIQLGDTWLYTENKTAVARFHYPIVATNNNPTLGNINPSGTINYLLGDNQPYVCTPNPGNYIVSVVVDGTSVFTGTNGTTAPYTHNFTNINAAHTIVVTFAVNCYSMNPGNVIPAGVTVTMSPANCVPHGSPVTFTFTTNCAEITGVTIGGTPQGVITSYTIPSVIAPLPLIVVQAFKPEYDIVATGSNDMGVITPAGTTKVPCGENQTYNFITDLGFRVSTLLIDGVSVPVPVSKSYTFTNVKAPHTIHVEFEEFPYYIIQFGPDAAQNAGGVVFPTLFPDELYYIAVDSGTVAFPFTIKADAGYVIDKVFVDGFIDAQAAQSGTYTFVDLHANHTIYATFKPVMFTINATATVGGTIDPAGAVQVPQGSNKPFIIMPNAGYHIVDVLVDGVSEGVIGSYTFNNVQANHTIHAVFAINTYTITPSAGINGNISPSTVQTVNHGANKTFNFFPATGYKVKEVLIDGVPDIAAALSGTYTFLNVSANHTIEVTFMKKSFTITSTTGANGTIYPLGVKYVDYWDHSEIYAFEPNEGFHIKQVLVDGTIDYLAIQNGIHRFMNVTENHTLHVTFAPNNFIITASATTGGAISPSGSVVVPNGTNKTFYFNAEAGYKLVRVVIDGLNNTNAVAAGQYTFTEVDDCHTISAQFEKADYTVTLPTVTGAVVTAVNGSSSPVAYGGKFMFVVDLLEGYTQSNVLVRANGMLINMVAGVYTIQNIQEDQIVTIDGVALNQYQITAKAGNFGGTITPTSTMVEHGKNATFTITPNANYKVDYLLVNGVNEAGAESYTMYNVKANGTVAAYFKYTPGNDIPENEDAVITVFSHSNIVTIENKNLVPVKQVEIMDMYGRVVWSGLTAGATTDITLNVAKGIYAVRITTEDNILTTTKISIK